MAQVCKLKDATDHAENTKQLFFCSMSHATMRLDCSGSMTGRQTLLDSGERSKDQRSDWLPAGGKVTIHPNTGTSKKWSDFCDTLGGERRSYSKLRPNKRPSDLETADHTSMSFNLRGPTYIDYDKWMPAVLTSQRPSNCSCLIKQDRIWSRAENSDRNHWS